MKLMWKRKDEEITLDAHGNAVAGTSYCPRPLTRNKLRQLMPQNRQLTSASLGAAFGRKPGWGKTRRDAMLRLDRMESQLVTAAEDQREKLLESRVLQLLRGWFGKPSNQQKRDARNTARSTARRGA